MESRINYVLFSEKKIPKNIGEIFLKSLWTFYPDRSYPILRYLIYGFKDKCSWFRDKKEKSFEYFIDIDTH